MMVVPEQSEMCYNVMQPGIKQNENKFLDVLILKAATRTRLWLSIQKLRGASKRNDIKILSGWH
jgi:hypothetical protein